MGLISKLFGSDKVVEAGINGIDKIAFTEEERSDAKLKFLKLYEPFKLAQRYLALIYCPAYVFLWFATGIAEFIIAFIDASTNLSNVYNLLEGKMGTANMLILGFYFGGGAVEGVVSKLMTKEWKKP